MSSAWRESQRSVVACRKGSRRGISLLGRGALL